MPKQQGKLLENMPAASSPIGGSTLLYVEQSGTSKKATVDQIISGLGGIQSDLQISDQGYDIVSNPGAITQPSQIASMKVQNGKSYAIQGHLIFTSVLGGGVAVRLNIGGAFTTVGVLSVVFTDGVTTLRQTADDTPVGSNNAILFLNVTGVIHNVSTVIAGGGSVEFNFGQNTAHASATTLKAGSYLTLIEIAAL